MFAIFFINIINRSIYVLIFNFFSDEYLIVRATIGLNKKFNFGEIFWGIGGIYQKSYNAVLLRYISCFIVQNFMSLT